MSRPRKTVLACLPLVLLLAVAGCEHQTTADQRNEWNRLADQRAVLIEERDALHTQILGLLKEVMAISPTGKNAADALPLLEDREAALLQAKKNEQSLEASWDEASRLHINQELKTFVGQQKEIAKLNLQWCDNDLELNAVERIVYEQGSKLSQADQAKLMQKLADLSAGADELASRIADEDRASEQYWNEHILGE